MRGALCTGRGLLGFSRKSCSTKATDHHRLLGQPFHHSHPHLLKENELVPGLSKREFVDRRARFAARVHESKSDVHHVVLVPSATVRYMSDKIPYVFRQNTDFLYLTGCQEPESALIMVVRPDGTFHTLLFVRESNAHAELWEGPRTGVRNSAQVFEVDESKCVSTLQNYLVGAWKDLKKATFWYDFSTPAHDEIHRSVLNFLSICKSKEVSPVKPLIHQLRLIKSVEEQKSMADAGVIASNAIETAIRLTKPGVTEHQIFATIDYQCRMNGADYLAYPPVVAAGSNATVIHYINNNQMLRDGDLILVDAGCELNGYCSDITRTWPVNGKFSDAQATLYEIVLCVQMELLKQCNEYPALDDLFKRMTELLGQRLAEAHVLTKKSKKLKLEEVAYKLCPHHVGHFLGMDVHDTSTVSRKTPCREGMAITIEPGVYINGSNELVQPEFRNIGIRIEDDVLFTSAGPKVLSSVPKSVRDLENLVGRNS
ncbi:Xaa-Pro aminopeptidase [Nesidiocoris tenuis]|uniref:Xaa-Pro aminopeptidase n=1 Tax=Nesidiocoris tenuis TaxID=355587 RepID=A0ABN7BBY3_9HEMI|nr:Xaa-Pro aminopeptidase [Nesidiocoris tenuis]